MRTLLVTGGAGFIGSTFVRQCLADGWRVVNLDALTYASSRHSIADIETDPNHTFVHGDIRNRELVAQLLRAHACDAVVHFAAESHVDRSIANPASFAETNVLGTLNLLDASLDYFKTLDDAKQNDFRFLHVSTDEVYGSLGETGLFTEESLYKPNSPYSASKAASDHFVRAYQETYGFPTLTTHCSNNYGPYQFPEKLIPLMTLNALQGKPLPVYGTGENVRDWIHVNDHCEAIRIVLKNGTTGDTYNIGGNCELSNLDVVHKICDAVDRLSPNASDSSRNKIKHVADRPGHDFRYAIDSSKMKEQLGWVPKTSFDEGIQQVVRWYVDNRMWVKKVSGDYQGERLGLESVND